MRTGHLTFAALVIILIFSLNAQSQGKAGRAARQNQTKTISARHDADSTEAFARLATLAADALKRERPDEAARLYMRALRLRPAWDEGWWMTGTLFYERERYAEARNAFQHFVAIKPDQGAGWTLLGLCLFRLHSYPEAFHHLERGNTLGIDGDELRSVANYHRALLLMHFTEFEQALELLRPFAFKDENPAIIATMGKCILRIPQFEEVVPAAQHELIMLAGHAIYHFSAGRLAEAQTAFAKLISLYPATPNVHYARAVFLLKENADEALIELQKELQISPAHVAARLQLAFEYIKRREYSSGLKFAQDAVELAPDSYIARNALGRIMVELGEIAAGTKELEKGVELAPDNPAMRFALSRAYARAGRQAEAERERKIYTQLQAGPKNISREKLTIP